MKSIYLSNSQKWAIGVFAAVLFIRAFGLVALFQYAPAKDGFGCDRHYAKKINYAKTDCTPDFTCSEPVRENFEPASHILSNVTWFFGSERIYSNSLRSPPVGSLLIL